MALIAVSQLAYDYKITDSLTLASQLAFKYEAIYNRDRTINKVKKIKKMLREFILSNQQPKWVYTTTKK